MEHNLKVEYILVVAASEHNLVVVDSLVPWVVAFVGVAFVHHSLQA